MIRNKKYFYILAAGLFLVGTGCRKYLDVNKNLNSPTQVPVSTLLVNAQLTIGSAMSLGTLSNGLSVYMHQQSTRENPDQYGMKQNDGTIEGGWAGLYDALKNLNVIINQGTAEGRFAYVGVAKILKAYSYSVLVDLWGDVPFSEFDQFKAGITQPKFDDDAAIYPQLFAMIDEAIADINNPAVNPSKPTTDDVMYSGNMGRWIKAANTLKLKLYTQLRKVQNVTPQVTALLAAPATLINATNESFLLPFGPLGATDDRHPGYGTYVASQKSQHVSPWMYEIMKGKNPNINTGINDPRVPYYIYNQATPAAAAALTNTEYRDGGFISLYFGSTGPQRNGSQQQTISVFGIYPVGGRYDDGLGGHTQLATKTGTGAAPQRLITYADRLYLEAELIQAGVIPGNARAVLDAAILESFKQVDYVITTYVKPSQTVPLVFPSADAYKNAVLVLFDAGNAEKKMEYIMTQKWLSNIGNSVDQYTDYRRTGYPVLFDPNNPAMAPGGFVVPPPPNPPVPVQRSNPFPISLFYPQSELELNSNAPDQKGDLSTAKIFWMP